MKSKKQILIVAIILLLLQLFLLFYFGTQKTGYHEDELYSYYSTNKTAGLFVEDRKWLLRDDLRNDFVVLPGEGFRYSVVRQMQSFDVHPPVYYYLLHTVSSLVPGVFSKWIGLGVNLLAYVPCFFLLLLLVRLAVPDFMKEKAGSLALLTCLVWGFAPAVVSGVMFIRMYQWLTLFILLCTVLHLWALKRQKFGISFLIPLAGVIFLGFLTQYYYIIFHVFLGAVFCLYLLFTKKWKQLLTYIGTCAAALAAAFLYYPSALSHIFRGYRGTEAVTEFADASNTLERLQFFADVFNEYVLGGMLIPLLLLLCLLAVTGGYLVKKRGMEATGGNRILTFPIFLLIAACTGYYFTVSKTALLLGNTSLRYQLPVYGILIFLLLYGLYALLERCLPPIGGKKRGMLFTAILTGIILCLQLFGLVNGKVVFLYREEAPMKAFVEQNRDEKVVVYYNEASGDHIWWLSEQLMEFPKVYLAAEGNEEPIQDEEIQNCDRLLVYIADHEEAEVLLKRIMQQNSKLTGYREIAQKNLWTLYELQ